MAVSFADRVLETWSGTGTGTISLGGAQIGFRAFSAAFATGNTCYYGIENPGTSEWEVGLGQLAAGTPWTLVRSTVLASSNANALVSFSAGIKSVFCDAPAALINLIQSSVQTSRQVASGTGLLGGGDLQADRTLSVDFADVAAYRAKSANKSVSPAVALSAMGLVSLVDGATVTPDFSAGIDFYLAIGGARTLANPTNLVAGQKGTFLIVQDGTGSRTLAFGSYYKWVGGVVGVLSTAPGAYDFIDYHVVSTTYVRTSLSKAWS